MALTLTTTADAADATTIAARIAEAEDRLRAALLAGDTTRAIHAEIASLRAAAARVAAQDADAKARAAAEAAQTHRARVTEAAAGYVRDIAQRRENRLAALVPSPFIIPPTTRRTTP